MSDRERQRPAGTFATDATLLDDHLVGSVIFPKATDSAPRRSRVSA